MDKMTIYTQALALSVAVLIGIVGQLLADKRREDRKLHDQKMRQIRLMIYRTQLMALL